MSTLRRIQDQMLPDGTQFWCSTFFLGSTRSHQISPTSTDSLTGLQLWCWSQRQTIYQGEWSQRMKHGQELRVGGENSALLLHFFQWKVGWMFLSVWWPTKLPPCGWKQLHQNAFGFPCNFWRQFGLRPVLHFMKTFELRHADYESSNSDSR